MDYQFIIKHRPGILHVLPDSLSRLYEACYTSTWGVPAMNPYDIIEQHKLNIDKDLLLTMTQPPPVLENKIRPTRKRTVSAASASRGGDMHIDIDMEDSSDSDADHVGQQVFPLMDQQRINVSNRPYNDRFEVRASPVMVMDCSLVLPHW